MRTRFGALGRGPTFRSRNMPCSGVASLVSFVRISVDASRLEHRLRPPARALGGCAGPARVPRSPARHCSPVAHGDLRRRGATCRSPRRGSCPRVHRCKSPFLRTGSGDLATWAISRRERLAQSLARTEVRVGVSPANNVSARRFLNACECSIHAGGIPLGCGGSPRSRRFSAHRRMGSSSGDRSKPGGREVDWRATGAHVATACLSRRRSRVRVPSLPFRMCLGIGHFRCYRSDAGFPPRSPISWPKPWKKPANGNFARVFVFRSHN